MRARSPWRGALVAAALLPTAAACTPDPATAIIVHIESDLAPVIELQVVRIRVERNGTVVLDDRPFDLRDGSHRLPGEFTLATRSPDDVALSVTVTGELASGASLSQHAIVHFVRGRTSRLDMFLAGRCLTETCGTGQTCSLGGCTTVDRGPLPDYTPPDGGAALDATAADARNDAAPDSPGEPPETDCFDGMDNDSDGFPDCEDPGCVPIAMCAQGAWTEPGTLTVGAFGSVPACAAPNGTQTYVGSDAPSGSPASCSACACGAPVASGNCSGGLSGVDEFSPGATCPPGISQHSTQFAATGCTMSNTFVSASFAFHRAYNESGSCALVTDTNTTRDPTAFTLEARVCATGNPPRMTGCDATSVCIPRAPDPARSCLTLDGDVTCPPGYGKRRVFYEDLTDDRACTPCSCTFASDGCNGDVEAFASSDCSGTATVTTTLYPTNCFTGDPASFRTSNPRSINPRCNMAGGASRGCAHGVNPTTVCCAPGTGDLACPTGPGPAMVAVESRTGQPFCMDSTEVTNEQYARFLDTNPAPITQTLPECGWNTSFVPTSRWPATESTSPVRFVDWCDAYAYCAWAGKSLCGRDGGGALLEGEAVTPASQWYQACTNAESTPVPYGSTANVTTCLREGFDDVHSDPCCATPSPRVYGLMTNTNEWVNACTGTQGGSDTCAVLGGWSDGPVRGAECASAAHSRTRNTHTDRVGFRCCSP